MKTVYKYPLIVTDIQRVFMPYGAQILSAQMQRESLCIWARVDTEAKLQERVIRIAGTGHEVKHEMLDFIDTFQMVDGALVFHVFEVLA